MGKLEDLAKVEKKYSELRIKMGEDYFYNFFRGNYERLNKYFIREIKRINSKYD